MTLELYHRESCPYCKNVRDFVSAKGLEAKIKYYDVDEDDERMEKLEAMNGDEQVPCLVIDGKPMLESDDIIEWLGKRAGELKK